MTENRLIKLIKDRIDAAENDSDAIAFEECLIFGEGLFKISIAFLVAGLLDDKDRTRYTIEKQLAMANGIGEWNDALDQILIGPAAVHLSPAFRPVAREISQNCPVGTWQHDAVANLREALSRLEELPPIGDQRLSLRMWFRDFVTLRNKTRGHGALTVTSRALGYNALRTSVEIIAKNCSLFNIQSAHIYRNLSGKYRVSPISKNSTSFDILKSSNTLSLENGLYLDVDGFSRVNLMLTDAELTDYFIANGAF